MKKVMFLLAVAGMFAFASCNNAAEAPAEEAAATETVVEEAPAAEEATIDSTVVDGVATEEAAATETPAAE